MNMKDYRAIIGCVRNVCTKTFVIASHVLSDKNNVCNSWIPWKKNRKNRFNVNVACCLKGKRNMIKCL